MVDETKYPTRIPPYGLRMPDDLKARIQAAAEANNRSMNAEIVARLQDSFDNNHVRQIVDETFNERMSDLIEELSKELPGILGIKPPKA